MILQELKKQLQDLYDGKPWYGPNLKDSLDSLDENCIEEIVGKHSIKDLLAHMINWRQFVIEKLSRNEAFEIEADSNQDWMPEELLRDISWENLKELLEITQNNLLKAIGQLDKEMLTETISRAKYSYQYLLFGIIQHDVYHLGQINIIKRAWKEKD